MFRVAAVLLTYATRRSIQVNAVGGGLLYGGFLMALTIDHRSPALEQAREATILVSFPAGIIGFVLVSQAKWQFVDPRARILPRFATAHLVTLLVAAVGGLLLLPCITGQLARLNTIGFAACSITLGASVVWSMHNNRVLPMLLALGTFYSLFSTAGVSFWLLPADAQQFRVYHVAILTAGWAAMAAWLVRLARLNEEDGDYQIPVQAQSGSATRLERSQASRYIGRQMARHPRSSRPADIWHDRLLSLPPQQLTRARLFRYGFAPVPAELSSIWVAIIMVAVGMFSSWSVGGPNQQRVMFTGALTPFYFIASMIPGQYLAMRRARLAQELLLPHSRSEFIDALLKSLARTTAITLGMLALAVLVLHAIAQKPLPAASSLAAYAIVAIAAQPYFYAMGVRAALYASAMGRVAIMSVAIIPGMIAGALGFKLVEEGYLLAATALSIVVAALGAWATAYARRKWLDAELG